MTLDNEDRIEIKLLILTQLKEIFKDSPDKEAVKRIKLWLREAEANKIALTDPAAADTYIKIDPEW